MKIYHLLSNVTKLEPISGDRLNEINFLTALSNYAPVYYNDQKFLPNEKNYGLEDIPITPPKNGYDLYIVRNNLEILRELPSPKYCLSYPYDEEAFKIADGVLTYNAPWKEGLENFHNNPEFYYDFFCGAYPKNMVAPKKVINIGQALHPVFKNAHHNFLEFRYRARFGLGFNIGYFGRIVKETLPNDYLSVLPFLKDKIYNLNTIFAGSVRTNIEDKSIKTVKNIPFAQMPFATMACDVLLANEQPEANWAGSAKPLEAMACGVPMLLTKRPSRIDQLGEKYPLFYSSSEELKDLIIKLAKDQPFYNDVKAYMLNRAELFYPENIGKEMLEVLTAKTPQDA